MFDVLINNSKYARSEWIVLLRKNIAIILFNLDTKSSSWNVMTIWLMQENILNMNYAIVNCYVNKC